MTAGEGSRAILNSNSKSVVKLNNSNLSKYPLLQSLLEILDLQLQPTYSTRDIANIFRVSIKTIQNRVAAGQLVPRDLPGRGKFLPQDLEEFLKGSRKGA